MAWESQTDNILTAFRTAIGTSLVINDSVTLTWQYKLEGPAIRWLDENINYPLIVLELNESSASGTQLLKIDTPVKISVVISSSIVGAIAPANYKTCRVVGEKVHALIMDAGGQLGTEWLQVFPRKWSVNYEACREFIDHALLVYEMRFDTEYFESA